MRSFTSGMAKSSPVSDTQTLLQSMLQRLKLQTNPEKNSADIQSETCSPSLDINGHSAESPSKTLVYQFGDQQEKNTIWTNLDNPLTIQSKGLMHNSAVLKENTDVISCNNNDKMPKWERKQMKFSLRKLSEDRSGVSSINTIENTLIHPHLSTLTPAAPPTLDSSGLWSENAGEIKKDNGIVPDKMTQTRASNTSKMKWWSPGQKRWTQKMKERWRDRRRSMEKKEGDDNPNPEQNEVAKMGHCPNPPEKNENTSYIALIEEENSVQHQSMNNGADEAPPSPLDYMSESTFSLGSFNLMEEIFTSEEWAKFFQSSSSSQSDSSYIPNDNTSESLNSISQASGREKSMENQWDYKEPIDLDLRMTPSELSSESFQQDMDTTEHTLIQTKTSNFSLSLDQTFELFKGQLELFDLGSEPLQSMDLSLSQSENNRQTEDQSQVFDFQVSQANTTEVYVHQSLSSEQDLSQSQVSDLKQGVHQKFLPLLDLSYLQSKNSSSLKSSSSLKGSYSQMLGSQTRKRGHSTLKRSSSDRVRGEIREANEWRNSVIPLYPVQASPRLSPASSISSLQYSISQDSETATTETVVKKRRLENTRRVTFAEEVIILPHLILSEDEEDESIDDGNDDDDDEEDDDDDSEDDDDESEDDEDDGVFREEPQPQPSVQNWIVALRSKTKKRPKFKLPRITNTPTKFRKKNKS